MSVKSYIESNKDRFLEELFSLIRIPSISAKHENKPDMLTCAQRWTEVLLSSGADKAEVMPTKGNPVVYAEKMIFPMLRPYWFTLITTMWPNDENCGRVNLSSR